MATNTIELTGIIEWAKLFESNRDNGEYDIETDGATTVDLIMDDETYQAMKDAGVRKQGRRCALSVQTRRYSLGLRH